MTALTIFTKRARNQINFPLFNNKLCVLGTNANKQQRLHQQRLHQLSMVVLPMLATATEEPRHDTKYVDMQAFVGRPNFVSTATAPPDPPPNPSMRFRCSPSSVHRLLATTSIVECTEQRCQLPLPPPPLPPPLPSHPTSLLLQRCCNTTVHEMDVDDEDDEDNICPTSDDDEENLSSRRNSLSQSSSSSSDSRPSKRGRTSLSSSSPFS